MILDHTYTGRAYRAFTSDPEPADFSEQGEHIMGAFHLEKWGPLRAYAILSNGEGDRWLVYVAEGEMKAAVDQCVTCGDPIRNGTRCSTCERNLEEDRLERESGR